MEKVASIETIKDILVHPNADALEIAQILGWHVIVKKGEFKAGDKCVYIVTDSILDDRPEYEFLRAKHFRVKAIKLRGVVSQGICFPVAMFNLQDAAEGLDVSEAVGAKHFEKPIPINLRGLVKGNFPPFLRKTDSERIQSCPNILNELQGREAVMVEKIDGTSFTAYFKDGEFGICSRNLELKEEEGNLYWKMARQYDLQNKLAALGKNYCIQAECAGEGIQGNKLGLKGANLFVFDIWDIDGQKYLDRKDLVEITSKLELEIPQVVWQGTFQYDSVDGLMEISNNLKYKNGSLAEGFVCRPVEEAFSKTLRGRMSFKVVSEKFLLKNDE